MGTEISVIENINAVEVFKAGGIDPIITAIRDQVGSTVYDVSTKKGRDECRSVAAKVAKSKTALDKMGKELSDNYRSLIAPINEERRKAKEGLQELQDEIRRPLTEYEASEKAREQVILDKINAFNVVVVDENGEQLSAQYFISALERIEMTAIDESFGKHELAALKAKKYAVEKLHKNIESASKREAEAVELERLRLEAETKRQKEHEERIAKEAADRAKREAEEIAKAEAERIEQEKLQAIRDKEAAEARAIAQKEAAERQVKESAERAERDRIEAINRERRLFEERESARVRHEQKVKAEAEEADRQRKANIEHRRSVNREILNYLVMAGITEDDAKMVIELSAKGVAGSLTINY